MQGMWNPQGVAAELHGVKEQSLQPWSVGLVTRPMSVWWPHFEVASPATHIAAMLGACC
jgi:hypothetical protein